MGLSPFPLSKGVPACFTPSGTMVISDLLQRGIKGNRTGTSCQTRKDRNIMSLDPFSIVTYCEALLKPNFYGEEICLRLLSMLFKVRKMVLDGDSLIEIKVRHQNTALNADAILIHISRCHYIALGKSFLFSFLYPQATCNESALQCIKFDLCHIAIHLQCIEIDVLVYVWFNLFSAEEFNEEVEGEVHHQHKLLSCLDLTTEGQYSVQNEDPSIYSDSEDDPMPRAWPDLDLPKPPAAAETMPPAIKQQFVKDMML